jgi:hypothetical protein
VRPVFRGTRAGFVELTLPSLAILTLIVDVADAVLEQECINKLASCVDCYDTDGPRDLLPIPDDALPKLKLNAKGYAIQPLRSKPTTHIYAVTENFLMFMVVLDSSQQTKAKNQEKGVNT